MSSEVQAPTRASSLTVARRVGHQHTGPRTRGQHIAWTDEANALIARIWLSAETLDHVASALARVGIVCTTTALNYHASKLGLRARPMSKTRNKVSRATMRENAVRAKGRAATSHVTVRNGRRPVGMIDADFDVDFIETIDARLKRR